MRYFGICHSVIDLPEKIISQVAESPYTRIPVWKDNNENIIGLIHSKNLLKILKDRQSLEITREEIKNSLIKTWFVPETTSLKDQLQMHLKRKIKLAMVVDEYGALNGMISLEDIIEEIVGDISDEHDIDMSDITQDKDGSIKVKGSTEIRNLNRSFNDNDFKKHRKKLLLENELSRMPETMQAAENLSLIHI